MTHETENNNKKAISSNQKTIPTIGNEISLEGIAIFLSIPDLSTAVENVKLHYYELKSWLDKYKTLTMWWQLCQA